MKPMACAWHRAVAVSLLTSIGTLLTQWLVSSDLT
jgi:hypothetical protein